MRNFDEAALPALVLAAAWKTKPWQLRTWVEPVRDAQYSWWSSSQWGPACSTLCPRTSGSSA